LYRHQKTAGCLYQAVLRRELIERLGLEWGPVEQGAADVRGVPRQVVEHFSQRPRGDPRAHGRARRPLGGVGGDRGAGDPAQASRTWRLTG
jgi:hypothetical protein